MDLLACTWLLHYSVGSGVTRVFFSFTVKMFSSVLVMVLVHVTTNSMNLYLALHYSLGSSYTRVSLVWSAYLDTNSTNSFSSALVVATVLVTTVSSNLFSSQLKLDLLDLFFMSA